LISLDLIVQVDSVLVPVLVLLVLFDFVAPPSQAALLLG
jgi:hypothetical protein